MVFSRIVCAAHDFQLVLAFEFTVSVIRSISMGCGSSDLLVHTAVVCWRTDFIVVLACRSFHCTFFFSHGCCWSPVVVACPPGRPRPGLTSRRPDLVVVLAGRALRCIYFLMWSWLELLLHLSAVVVLVVVAQGLRPATSPSPRSARFHQPAPSLTVGVSSSRRRFLSSVAPLTRQQRLD